LKISASTIELLKNYGGINSNIIIKSGSTLRTIAKTKTIMAQAVVGEVFPREVCIYDVNQLLGTLSLFDDPDIDFMDKYMIIKEGKAKSKKTQVKYFYSARNVMDGEAKSIDMPPALVSFRLDENDYNQLIKAANTLILEDFSVESDGKVISLTVFDKKNKGSNTFSIDVGVGNGDKYQMIFKTKNLKMIPGTYDVEIAPQAISRFKHTGIDLEYFVAVDAASKVS